MGRQIWRCLCGGVAGIALLVGTAAAAAVEVPILVYHRFAPEVRDSMTVRTATFDAQLGVLHDEGYQVIPLRWLVDRLAGRRPALPPKSVVITADDGHRSVFEVMWPRVRARQLPITLFIYPSAISRADYAMTWEQLRMMKASGGVDVQSHTYWHPNFHHEQARLSASAYQAFVRFQLEKPRAVLLQRLGPPVADLLAWPFGLYDAQLEHMASEAGYQAAFTLAARPVSEGMPPYALPRFLMVDGLGARAFSRLLRQATREAPP